MALAPTTGERLQAVRDEIADAAREASRDPGSITTIVVTKFHPASLVRELAGLGVRDFGENRHQEAQPKALELEDLHLTWHFVGQLQSKKARQVAGYADSVHSVDRGALVDALAGAPRAGARLDVFLQVSLTDDPARGGIAGAELEPLVERVLAAESLRLRGLMAVAPLEGDARAAFATVRAMSERLVSLAPEASSMSMGMSGDFREAILEGATHLRIGTAITGNRPDHG